MKKLEKRAILCLLLVLVLVLGLALFVYRLETKGDTWGLFYANKHIYKDGRLTVGTVVDRNNVILLQNTQNGPIYTDDIELRKANFHVVGDRGLNVSTGANAIFKSELVGYNRITGANSRLKGGKLTLTVDSELNRVAYNALSGRNGFVGVYNYKTGEILSMVSSPYLDPDSDAKGDVKEGTYINKVLSGTFTPGSTFKLVTTASAIENLPDIDKWTFTCTGSYDIDGEKITCPSVHGTMDFYGALANSCNCAYAELTLRLGKDNLSQYVEKFNLTKRYDINGIKTKKGNFDFEGKNIDLAWSGIGQYKDQINPLAMMVYVGAIAGEGKTKEPYLTVSDKYSSKDITLLKKDTANKLRDMMRNNVRANYGDSNYPNLELCAKSGTAQTGEGNNKNAWFCGFSGDYAFIVCVENGGAGKIVAGPVANKVLQAINIKK